MSDQEPIIQTIRTFVAIAIDEAARQKLAEAQNAMKRISAGVRWVAPLNIHLTFVFLGDIFDNLVCSIRKAIDRTAACHSPSSLAIQGLGYFGSPTSPKVIWAGLQGNLQPLMLLQAELVAALKAADLSPDTRKAFNPHLTLGRARSCRQPRDLVDFIRSRSETPFGRVDVQSVLLIKSQLTPQGPIYAILHESPLNPAITRPPSH